MKKKRIKPSGSVSITCPVGFNDKKLDNIVEVFEKELNRHAREKGYKINGLIWIYTLSRKSSKRK